MELWHKGMVLVKELRGCCTRKRTFFWLMVVVIGFITKPDFLGVTSLARGVGLSPCYYTCLLNFFNSANVNLDVLCTLWIRTIFRHFTSLVRLNGRALMVGDGLKNGKEGKKMPGVKLLYQESNNNSKAPYIMGHSLQVVAILAKGLKTHFAIPLVGKIHEGIRYSCRDSRTLLDKMYEMVLDLNMPEKFYFIADKYYCSGRFMKRMVAEGIDIITMMKRNAVAYYPPAPEQKRRGRPKRYGKKIKLFSLFDTDLSFTKAPMPGKPKLTIEYAVVTLLWRPLGEFVQFVLVRHPEKGQSICMSTDLTISPLDIILGYSLRFKIEVSFKQAIYQIGTFMYRFWVKNMKPIKWGDGDRHLQFAPKKFKEKIARKIHAYHLFVQLGFIAQGIFHYLSIHQTATVWRSFGSWLRTIRDNTLPSEKVVSMALAMTYIEFLGDRTKHTIFKKFLRERAYIGRIHDPGPEKEDVA